jgi:hypothetical protein
LRKANQLQYLFLDQEAYAMKIGKKVFASLLTLTLIVSTAPSAFAAETGYPDVPAEHWASQEASQ